MGDVIPKLCSGRRGRHLTLPSRRSRPRHLAGKGALLVAPVLLGGCPLAMEDEFRVGAEARFAANGGTAATQSTMGGDASTSSTFGGATGGGPASSPLGGMGLAAGGSSVSNTSSGANSGGVSNPVSATSGTAIGSVALRGCGDRVVLTKTAISTPTYPAPVQIVANLNGWDQATSLSDWVYEFRSNNAALAKGRISSFDDDTGSYEFGLVSDGSSGWAARGYNSRASDWGGGVALVLDCLDATPFSGIAFRARGFAPSGRANLFIRIPAVGNVQQSFQLGSTWRSYQLSFMGFVASSDSPGARMTADGIDRLAFAPELNWMNGNATPGSFEIVVDDVGFY